MITFQRSADTEALMRALAGVNQDVSYTSLAQLSGLSTARVKEVLPSARRGLLRQNKIVFGTLRGYGLKRLNEAEKIDETDGVKKRVRRAAGRGLRVLAAVDFSALSNRDRVRESTNRTIFSLIRSQTTAVKDEQPQAKPQAQVPETAKLRAIIGGTGK